MRSIGRLAIKVQAAADSCIQALLDLIETKVSYVVQEAVIVIKDVFRRYPGKYEGIIPKLCEHLDLLDEPESKAAVIWIIGQFANRIDNADELMDDLTYTFLEEPTEVRECFPVSLCMNRCWKICLGAACVALGCGQTVYLQSAVRHDKGACS